MKSRFVLLISCLILTQFSMPSVFAEDGDNAYDPFIDYNEFEIADEEEADINFFRNGRFLTAGFTLGQRDFTDVMGNVYKEDITYGLYLSYFFDMRFALQFGYLTSSHALSVRGPVTHATGTLKVNGLSVDLKYYLNTQNVTKGLAALNPYLIAGFTSFGREAVVDGQPDFGKDDAIGFDLGAGIEIPMLRNKMYFGAQAMYQVVSFTDENSEILLNNGSEATGIHATGDTFTILGILGVNF